MARRAIRFLLKQIHDDAGSGANPPDCVLLQRFVAERDEAAFTLLLQRHGPFVLGVCRRLLGDSHAAEDAFQAVFLILARKGASIRQQTSLAAWLHRVASNVARTARTSAARRRIHEERAQAMTPAEATDEPALREWHPVLHEEVNPLPEKFRLPVVLCYLRGKAQEEAAQELGWPLGTVKSRLARARESLRGRLTRRGLTLAEGAVAGFAAESAAPAAVPANLEEATRHAALALAAGEAAAAVAPAPVVAMMQGVAGVGAALKVKVAALVGVMLLLFSAGVGWVTLNELNEESAVQAPDLPAVDRPPETKRPEAKAPTDQQGDALPAGALARMGSMRFRHGGYVRTIAYSSNGKVLASSGNEPVIRLWDPATGRQLRELAGQSREVFALAFLPGDKGLVSTGGERDTAIHIWDPATGQERRQLKGANPHTSFFHLAVSPDGKFLATAGSTGPRHLLHIWDLEAGKPLHERDEERGYLSSLAFTPDSKTLAVGERSGTIRLWSAATGKELGTLPGHARGLPKFSLGVTALTFSPDGRSLASAGADGMARLWDMAERKQLHKLKFAGSSHSAADLAFAPNGRTLAAAVDDALCLWDPATGKELHRIKTREWAHLISVAFAPDSRTVLVGGAMNGLRRFDVATGQEMPPWQGHEGDVLASALSADGQTLATAGMDRTVRLWETAGGRELRVLRGHTGQVLSVAFAPDGKTVASTGYDRTVRVWRLADGKELFQVPGQESHGGCVAFTSDGRFLAAASSASHQVRLLDAASGKLVRSVGGNLPMCQLALAPDGRTLVTGARGKDRAVVQWDLATGRRVRQLEGPFNSIECVACSPDGALVGACCHGGAWVWEAATGKLRRVIQREEPFRALAFSPDGRSLALAGREPVDEIWELSTGKVRERCRGHRGIITTLAFARDGRLVSAGHDTTALVWDGTRRPAAPRQAPSAEDLLDCWNTLAKEDAAQAWQAIRSLAAAPEQSVPYLGGRLMPVPDAEAARIRKLIADLDAPQFAERQRASDALEALGEAAADALRRALEAKPALDVRQRLERLLKKLEGAAPSPALLRVLRAVEALEMANTDAARRLLKRLAAGAEGAPLTKAARASLQRLAP
jgi:RNA polymerase sigma factor (sigma-70 family)